MATRRERCSRCNALLQMPKVLNVYQLMATRRVRCSRCNALTEIPPVIVNARQLTMEEAEGLTISQLMETRRERCSGCNARLRRDPKAVNQALQSGAPVQTIKKFDAPSNKKTTGPVVKAKKLDEATEPGSLGRVSVELRQAIQKARLEKKMGQAELAKQINERPQVVGEYENGKAVPNQAVLAKMERVLGVKLRGKVGK